MKNIILSIGLLLLVGGIGYFFYTALSPATPVTTTVPPLATQTEPALGPLKPKRTPPAGFTEYRNEAHRFAFFYPSTFKVKEFDEGKGAVTITVESSEEQKGMQIFVVPYAGVAITPERFKEDIPSGVIKEYKDSTLDGVSAGTFISSDTLLGETREVWAIRGGNLYEITTLKVLDTWFIETLGTWQFL